MFKLVTVEPVEFIYCVMFSLSAVVRDNLFIEKGKQLSIGTSDLKQKCTVVSYQNESFSSK